jgi:2-polyprenyl-6-methoxyphenol hydroxylase-like FAD-dependent oxidoreductase
MACTSLQVIVIGGGIGGLCLAQALKAADIGVAVYERNPANVWPAGYRIHINPVGSQSLRACLPPMLWDILIAVSGAPPAGLGFLTEQLAEMLVIGKSFMLNQGNITIGGHHPINRIALRHLLLSGLEQIVHFDTTFERYEQTPDGKVTAFFTDHTSATGDLLVGADGANSRVRQQFLPHARRVETGAVGVGGKLPLNNDTRAWLPRQLTGRMNLVMPSSRYTLFTAAFDASHRSAEALAKMRTAAESAELDFDLFLDTAQDYMLWAFIAQADAYPPDVQRMAGAALRAMVGGMTAGWHPLLRRAIAESDPASIALNPFKTSLPVQPWPSTNITLLGDAIHNMPPVGGLGGNMALRDASQLARRLLEVQQGRVDLISAIQAYEGELRAYGFAAVESALSHTRQAISSNRAARELGKAWFRLCRAVPPLMRLFEASWTAPMRIQP